MVAEHLTEAPIDLAGLIVATDDDACGALALFVGTVRGENDGRRVAAVTYEAHPTLAEATLVDIERETLERFAVRHCRIVHRTGLVALGEASVVIVVRSAHRHAAFPALRHAIEELKARVSIWKLEHYVDGDAAYLAGVPLVAPRETTR